MDFFSSKSRRPHVADPLESCLLDRELFIGSSTNATTARHVVADPDGRQRDILIQVSLFIARPPRISNVLIRYTGTWFTERPVVVATLGGLVLLSLTFYQKWSSPTEPQFFLYQPGAASLYSIPQPSSGDKRLDAQPYAACLLPHPHGGDGDYLITALVNDEPGELDLFLYSSMTRTWTIKTPILTTVPDVDGGFVHMTYKAIPVGGGSTVAFVDFWTGILFCDVLDGDRPKLHHLPLPSTGLSKESTPRVGSISRPRDVAIEQVSGSADFLRISFVEVVCLPLFESWRATTWSTTTAATTPWRQLHGWRKCSDVSDLDLSVADGICFDGLLPETQEWDSDDDDGYEGQRTLGSLYLDRPLLSLHQDNVVCFMVTRYMKKTGTWIIAVDMANKKLQGVYLCVRLTAHVSYSTISIHGDMSAAPVVKGDLKRLGDQMQSYPHKKMYREQMVSSRVDEQEQCIMATQDGDDMDLDNE